MYAMSHKVPCDHAYSSGTLFPRGHLVYSYCSLSPEPYLFKPIHVGSHRIQHHIRHHIQHQDILFTSVHRPLMNTKLFYLDILTPCSSKLTPSWISLDCNI